MLKRKELEIYIHIPFCIKKCRYCDFLSAPAGKELQDAYMDALCKELRWRSKDCRDYEISTIFFGGGTPSIVEPVWISRIMDILNTQYYLCESPEITMEMNPGTVSKESLTIYKNAGINRLSIGLQTADAEELKTLGRIHNYEQFADAYMQARDVGFENINVDIMSALPGQSYESYENTLKKITALVPPPEHISAYSLIVEEGTPFEEEYRRGNLLLPDEDTERRMYELTGAFLQKYGYERYEISNYAKKGRECKHNVGYWKRKNYLGFGIGAASMIENVRFSNTSDINAYIADPNNARLDRQVLTKAEQMEETMFLGLRLVKGVSFCTFKDSFGVTIEEVYGSVVEKHVAEGLLREHVSENGERYLSLTDRGLDVSNYVMADFLEPGYF